MTETDETQFVDPALYELGFLLIPTIAEDALGTEVNALREAVEAEGGRIVSEGYPTLRPLAYPIATKDREGRTHYSNAYFGHLVMELLPERTLSLKARLDKSTTLLRFLIIHTYKEVPQPVRPRVERSVVSAESLAVDKKELSDLDKEQIEKGIEELLIEEESK